MSRCLTRRLFVAFLLLGLSLLPFTQAAALPQGALASSAAEPPEASPGLLSQLWRFLSALWSENGSGLEPNGANGTEPNAATGDNGSILDPDG